MCFCTFRAEHFRRYVCLVQARDVKSDTVQPTLCLGQQGIGAAFSYTDCSFQPQSLLMFPFTIGSERVPFNSMYRTSSPTYFARSSSSRVSYFSLDVALTSFHNVRANLRDKHGPTSCDAKKYVDWMSSSASSSSSSSRLRLLRRLLALDVAARRGVICGLEVGVRLPELDLEPVRELDADSDVGWRDDCVTCRGVERTRDERRALMNGF